MLSSYYYVFCICATSYFIYFFAVLANNVVLRIRMNNSVSESLETIFWFKILQFCYADPGSRMEKIRIPDPG
jgi:hypothetical protein